MAAEFYITFPDPSWLGRQKDDLIEKIESLPTYVRHPGDEYWLLGWEDRDSVGRGLFDVRLLIKEATPVFLEISAHPPSVEQDLKLLFSWLRSRTALSIVDEDGEPSGW
jgi:hypothetical protein